MHDVRKMYSYKSLTLAWLFKFMRNNSLNTPGLKNKSCALSSVCVGDYQENVQVIFHSIKEGNKKLYFA